MHRKLPAMGALLMTAAIVAQERGQPPTFRSRADLVQVDVVVVDADGRSVRGLKAPDFTLLDRRKPQALGRRPGSFTGS